MKERRRKNKRNRQTEEREFIIHISANSISRREIFINKSCILGTVIENTQLKGFERGLQERYLLKDTYKGVEK